MDTTVRRIRWVDGYGAKVSADVAAQELDRIRGNNGGELTADLVLSEARVKSSPLHPQIIDKSVKKAAEAHYLDNAGKMLRSIIIVYGDADNPPKIRKFSVIRSEPSTKAKGRTQKFYSSTEEALTDPGHREYILADAIREVATWRRKYASLSELAQIFRAIDKIAAGM